MPSATTTKTSLKKESALVDETEAIAEVENSLANS
jgi:hypothetical protein